jgi:hypothetical protein
MYKNYISCPFCRPQNCKIRASQRCSVIAVQPYSYDKITTFHLVIVLGFRVVLRQQRFSNATTFKNRFHNSLFWPADVRTKPWTVNVNLHVLQKQLQKCCHKLVPGTACPFSPNSGKCCIFLYTHRPNCGDEPRTHILNVRSKPQ